MKEKFVYLLSLFVFLVIALLNRMTICIWSSPKDYSFKVIIFERY